MSRILITGATGNIGVEVIRFLMIIGTSDKIVAGVRNIEKAKKALKDYPNLEYVPFDFDDPETFDIALKNVDRIFLLRPPHISDVDRYFRPLISAINKNHIHKVLFLSVQGAEKSKVIPHNKIEHLIQEAGISYIFLRPSYFMQNLTTTLMGDIQSKREIVLPAGKARFNWIDIENIAEAAAVLLIHFEKYKDQALEITGLENENFETVTLLINQTVKRPIKYRNVNPFTFYSMKKKEGMVTGMIIVMILLHFLPRFQQEPRISDVYERLTGKRPTSLKTFIEREKAKLE